ncbi:hypothetical protein BC835DRAFT_953780 [Cytidiella melzeri]|nr:hypothetical protein BC835DRAFT_953780 [Cytidiella melzeri]
MQTTPLTPTRQRHKTLESSQDRRRYGMIWTSSESPLVHAAEDHKSECRMLPNSRPQLSVTEPAFETVSPPETSVTLTRLPSTPAQAVISKYRAKRIAKDAEDELLREAREFDATTWKSIEEKLSHGESLINQLAEYADVATTLSNDGDDCNVSPRATCNAESKATPTHEEPIPELHAKILAEVTADPSETLLSDELKPHIRRSPSVRFDQSTKPEVRAARNQAFVMFVLNGFPTDGCQFMCRHPECRMILPTFRSLTYHLHLHDVKPDSKGVTPVRAYCHACSMTFETNRDLLVHPCSRVMELLEQQASVHGQAQRLGGRARLAKVGSFIKKSLKSIHKLKWISYPQC